MFLYVVIAAIATVIAVQVAPLVASAVPYAARVRFRMARRRVAALLAVVLVGCGGEDGGGGSGGVSPTSAASSASSGTTTTTDAGWPAVCSSAAECPDPGVSCGALFCDPDGGHSPYPNAPAGCYLGSTQPGAPCALDDGGTGVCTMISGSSTKCCELSGCKDGGK